LLERVATHDKEAFLDLYAQFAPVLLGMAEKITGRRGASAAVEGTFLSLWRQARHLPPESASVAAWLVVEGRRVALEGLRANVGTEIRPPVLSPSWLPRPEEVLKLESKRELLRKILRQLPKAQEAALAMAVWEGLTEEAIAAKTGEPLAKVQSLLRAGMRFVRHRMKVVLGTWSANI